MGLLRNRPPPGYAAVSQADSAMSIDNDDIEGQLLSQKGPTVTFSSVTYDIPLRDKKSGSVRILDDICGLARPGEILGIIGPSGAGKTTLLDIIAQRQKVGAVQGDFRLDGHTFSKTTFQQVCGYVFQDDVLVPTLTVREQLMFTASLRLPKGTSTAEIASRVNSVIIDLGLSKVADKRCGDHDQRGLSGGERKRTSIAIELVTEPRVLILDEPTSGLDSSAAASLIRTLKRLAEKGQTILCSIHQPRIDMFRLIDSVIVLDSQGQLLYQGSTAADHFDAYFASQGFECPAQFNPADFVLESVCFGAKGKRDQLAENFKKSKEYAAICAEVTSLSREPVGSATELDTHAMRALAPVWRQYALLWQRAIRGVLRNRALLMSHWLVTALVALFVGIVYYDVDNDLSGAQNRLGSIFFIVIYLAFGALSVMDVFTKERTLFMRERANGVYTTLPYYLSKVAVDFLLLRVIPPLLLGSISYWMIGFNAEPRAFGTFLLVLVFINLNAAAVCTAISCAVNTVSVANFFSTLVLLFFLMFAGFLINLDKIPSYALWMRYLSCFSYGFEALVVNEMKDTRFVVSVDSGVGTIRAPFSGSLILEKFGFDPDSLEGDVSVLVMMTLGYVLLGFVLLLVKQREKR